MRPLKPLYTYMGFSEDEWNLLLSWQRTFMSMLWLVAMAGAGASLVYVFVAKDWNRFEAHLLGFGAAFFIAVVYGAVYKLMVWWARRVETRL